jgi:NAD(P)H-nitrite reductase large subunit
MHHVIIGAGPAGVIAAETLRKADGASRVTIVGDEPEPPYSRMAIPYLLADDIDEAGTYLRKQDSHYEDSGINVVRDRVKRVDRGSKMLVLAGARTLSYDKLLVASGSHPAVPPVPGIDLPGVHPCWTMEDARHILGLARKGTPVLLMGAGFIGCIILEALVARGVDLTVVELADRMLARMMDDTGGDMIKRWCEGKGVKVLTSTRVTALGEADGGVRLHLDGAAPITADLVVCATGVAPNVDFLEGSGVEVDAGVLVDDRLRTNVDGIYAAGDVAQGPSFPTGAREVHAIQPTASEHGRIAARNMAGHDTPYRGSLSMNVLNTLGLVSSSFGVWMGLEGGDRAVVSDPARFKYLRLEFDEDRVVGALAIGLTQHVGVIRGLVQTQVPLGAWKDVLLEDPHRVMDAYLDCTQASAA